MVVRVEQLIEGIEDRRPLGGEEPAAGGSGTSRRSRRGTWSAERSAEPPPKSVKVKPPGMPKPNPCGVIEIGGAPETLMANEP